MELNQVVSVPDLGVDLGVQAQNADRVADFGGQADTRWIDAFKMQAAVLQELDDAMRLLQRPAPRKILRFEKAAHVVPVALIQLTDFASDLTVIVQLAMTAGGAAADWIVCVVAVGPT